MPRLVQQRVVGAAASERKYYLLAIVLVVLWATTFKLNPTYLEVWWRWRAGPGATTDYRP